MDWSYYGPGHLQGLAFGALQIEFERLQVDKRAQATPLRVEKLARDKLKMFDNSPARTHYVALSESGQVLSSSPAKVQEVAP